MLHLHPTTEQTALLTILKRRARLQKRWDTSDPAQVLNLSSLKYLRDAAITPESFLLRNMAILDLTIGNRMADFARVEKQNIFINNTSVGPVFSVKLVSGKTVNSTGPFVIHIPVASEAGHILTLLYDCFPTSPYLLINTPKLLAPDSQLLTDLALDLSNRIRDDLRQSIPRLTIRALRRGGLSSMGNLEVPTSTILTYSRHTTEKSLLRYMGDGIHNLDLAVQQTNTTLRLENAAEHPRSATGQRGYFLARAGPPASHVQTHI